MTASDLARILPGAVISGSERVFTALRADSTRIRTGEAFIALKGSVTDGHRFISDALRRGACLVICNAGHPVDAPDATILRVPDTKAALPAILNMLHPEASEVEMVGVTGTNGKTTTTYLIESVLARAGKACGVIGTISTRYPGREVGSSLTTPGPLDLFEMLHSMHTQGVKVCVMEVSSHALDQDRINGLAFHYALFTNLSQDHLDYHHDMETYFLAKRRLFSDHLKGTAVLNTDDGYGSRLFKELRDAVSYGFRTEALIHPLSLDNTSNGLTMLLRSPQGDISLRSVLKGEMNAYNIMAAVGICQAMGIPLDRIREGIEDLQGVPGRMESVTNPKGLSIIVDYAHTPDALDTVLKNTRAFTRGRLLTVFGCGGDRDRTKRPIMGSIAASRADHAFVTSDNPRSEDPLAIIEDILKGITDRDKITVEPDRRQAICRAIREMKPEDCLVIAGKGHEDYQIIGTTRIMFDDRLCVRQCLEEGQGQ
jgi:UDP-N-acetylmuramoyl-L-alanyl-D-glutamate--2,6-diaminopimelate ligase